MEINLVDEEPSIIKIGNQKALRYRVKYNGKNIDKIHVYNQWLDLMKTEKEYNGLICYCVNCYLFFYFRNKREKWAFKHNDHCLYIEYAEFCQYCGELYTLSSICCIRKAIKNIERELYSSIKFDCLDYILYFPFLSLLFYFARFFHTLTSLRNNKQDINYKYDSVTDNKCVLTLFILTALCFSISFFLLYLEIFYIWHIIFFTKIWNLKIKDRNENFVRY